MAKSMEMTNNQTLAFVHSHGYEISLSTLFRAKAQLRKLEHKWTRNIALQDGLLDQHITRIQKLETAEKELWFNYHRLVKEHPEKAASILPAIVSIQPFISAAYRSIKNVLEAQVTIKKKYESQPMAHI